MLPVNIGFDPAASLNAPCPAPKGGGATPAATGPGSFHTMLRDAAAATAEAPANTAPAHGKDAVNETGRGAAADEGTTLRPKPRRRTDQTAVNEIDRTDAAAKAEAPANTAPAQRRRCRERDRLRSRRR